MLIRIIYIYISFLLVHNCSNAQLNNNKGNFKDDRYSFGGFINFDQGEFDFEVLSNIKNKYGFYGNIWISQIDFDNSSSTLNYFSLGYNRIINESLSLDLGYAQNFSTNWSAMRVLDEFSEFNPDEGNQLLFTGEMLYPWMFDIYKNLKPFKGAANILANKDDWPILYDKNILRLNKVPVYAAVYENDMYVDRNYSIETAGNIGNIKIWETNEYEHNGLRSDGDYILNTLFNM